MVVKESALDVAGDEVVRGNHCIDAVIVASDVCTPSKESFLTISKIFQCGQ